MSVTKYAGEEALQELVIKMKAYADGKGLTVIAQDSIRITDYDAGAYIWRPQAAGNAHNIYYSGTEGTEYVTPDGAYLGDLTLFIGKSRTSVTNYAWVWMLLCGDCDLYVGHTTANSGSCRHYLIDKLVQHSDVINNLTTTTFVQGQALHARQGKVLKDLIDALTTTVNGKQDILTFDTTPTENSANPVTSSGLYTKFNLKADKTAAVGSFDLSIDNTTYVITLQAKDVNGNNLGTAQTIDLPLESVVVSGSYDSATQKVILTLKDGSTIDFSVADLISGLQTEITSTNKLSADLVDDTNTTHKFVSATDISNWNSKQNALTFDDTPMNGSNNPVKSSGIYTALSGKQNTLVAGTNITIDPTTNTISATGGASITVDSALSTTSENPVQNKVIAVALNNEIEIRASQYGQLWDYLGNKEETLNKVTTLSSASTDTQYPSAKLLYNQLLAKQSTLTFDSTPKENSSNPVTSNGVYDALYSKATMALPTSSSFSLTVGSSTVIIQTGKVSSSSSNGWHTVTLPEAMPNATYILAGITGKDEGNNITMNIKNKTTTTFQVYLWGNATLDYIAIYTPIV